MRQASMTCREVAEFLMDYLSAELSAPARDAFDAHIHDCPPCIAYLDSYRETVRLGKVAFSDPDAAAADVPPELVTAILRSRKRRS